jgi:hypothetical protein
MILIMVVLAIALSGMFRAVNAQSRTEPLLLVRLDNVSRTDLLRTGVVTEDDYRPGSLVSFVMDTAWLVLTPALRDSITNRGLRGTVVLEDPDTLRLVRRAMYGPTFQLEAPYHTYATLNAELDSLQKAHPGLMRVFTIGTTTAGKLPIRAVKISANVRKDDDRPAILFDGCHHSNEILGAEICMNILSTFVSGYGTNPAITRWLKLFQVYVVPVLNVDGYRVVTSGEDPRWRKNRRDTNGDGTLDLRDGVDINRNYDFNWAHGGSPDPMSERYRGSYPFSESENRAFAGLARSRRFLASLTYHSQGEVIYYPWNWKGRKAPDDSLLTSIARSVAGSIRTMNGDTNYRAEYGAGLVGQSYPWLYGTLGTFDFVVETGRGASFPPAHFVKGIVEANMEGVRALFRRAEGPGIRLKTVEKRSGKPVDAEVWLPGIETEEVHRRRTRPGTGVFHRLLLPGSYQVIVRAEGYAPLVLNGVAVKDSGWTEVPVALERGSR